MMNKMEIAGRPLERNPAVLEFALQRGVISKQLRTCSVPNSVPFALLAAFQATSLIRTISSIINKRRADQFLNRDLMIGSLTLLFFIYLTIRFYIPGPNLVYSVIPLFSQNCLFIGFKVQNVYRIQEFSYRIECGFKLSLSLTLLFVGMKEHQLIPWNWFYIFWPVWIVILSLVLIGLGQLINGFRLIRLACRNQGNCMDSVGAFWLAYCLYGLATCFGYLFFSIAMENGGVAWVKTSSALLALLIYFIGLFVLTFLFNSILM